VDRCDEARLAGDGLAPLAAPPRHHQPSDGRLERQRLRQHRAQVARADNHRRHAVHPAL
jgi:hypothetical protein